jgi:DNA modification methylase
MLPLLQAIHAQGGSARPRDLYDDVAERLGVSEDNRTSTTTINGRSVNLFERRVRWCRQTAVVKGLISKEADRVWRLTETANCKLGNIVQGKIVTFAISEQGAFLCGSAEDVVGIIEPGSLSLIMTSPPYPLLTPKAYWGVQSDLWVGWLLELCAKWKDLLTPEGSMMLNIGPVFKKGVPAQQLHVERLIIGLEDQLGIHLLQRLDWFSPTKMPSPLEWVSQKRMRVTNSVEPILWCSPSPFAHGNNRNLLRPYTAGGLRAIEKPRLKKRPGGFVFGPGSFKDCGGSIPPSLITATPCGKEEVRYRKAVRAAGREPHPAILPAAVAQFGIKLATEVGDTVYDPFCGSGTVVAESLKLGRKAIGSDRSFEYLEGAMIRCQVEQLEMNQVFHL